MQERIEAIRCSQKPLSVYEQNTMRMLKQNRADNPTDHRGCSERMGNQRRITMTSVQFEDLENWREKASS